MQKPRVQISSSWIGIIPNQSIIINDVQQNIYKPYLFLSNHMRSDFDSNFKLIQNRALNPEVDLLEKMLRAIDMSLSQFQLVFIEEVRSGMQQVGFREIPSLNFTDTELNLNGWSIMCFDIPSPKLILAQPILKRAAWEKLQKFKHHWCLVEENEVQRSSPLEKLE